MKKAIIIQGEKGSRKTTLAVALVGNRKANWIFGSELSSSALNKDVDVIVVEEVNENNMTDLKVLITSVNRPELIIISVNDLKIERSYALTFNLRAL